MPLNYSFKNNLRTKKIIIFNFLGYSDKNNINYLIRAISFTYEFFIILLSSITILITSIS